MSKEIISKTTGKTVQKIIGNTSKNFVKNLNPLDFVTSCIEYKKIVEEQKTQKEAIRAKRDTLITAIEGQKELILKYFECRFSERREALGHFFELLDNAVDLKNEKMLDVALTGIVGIVKDNPLRDFESFSKSIVEGKIIEI